MDQAALSMGTNLAQSKGDGAFGSGHALTVGASLA